ncbi:DUF4232 domain-containing protein [Streptomyces cadmiisoli]|uniref:DUF4232 domain-containing protein n=1 Tax=Streptomyces cadmiisoli TaxID=2184053 RepID=A0A2Z4JEN7_9ACTN|nr:DUF4232 domain-containing protein [Streptomyces cadmiisoli]AWW43447.1 DUF4232 domain-containing protein [Streptomyces cadmiisoli]
MGMHLSTGNALSQPTATTGHRLAGFRGRAAAIAGSAVLMGLLTACGSTTGTDVASPADDGPASSSSQEPSDASAGSGNGPSSTSDSGSDASKGSSSSGDAAGTGTRCRSSDLKAYVGDPHGAAGSVEYAISVVNFSDHTCTLYGFPGMAFTKGADEVGRTPERDTSLAKERVTLAPGKRAWAGLRFAHPEVSGGRTITPDGLAVTPPDETSSIGVDWLGGPVPNSGAVDAPTLTPFTAEPMG